MKANEFVKKFGWDYTRGIITACDSGFLPRNNNYNDLKDLIESHELVMDYYGLAKAKEHAESNYTAPELKDALKQAIADVESCQ